MTKDLKQIQEDYDLLQKDHCKLIIENKILRQEIQYLLDSSYKLRAKRGHVADKTLEPLRYF
jgi:hypothetical protein